MEEEGQKDRSFAGGFLLLLFCAGKIRNERKEEEGHRKVTVAGARIVKRIGGRFRGPRV